MPVRPCPNGKFRIGSGACIYDDKASAERAYKGYLWSKYHKRGQKHGTKKRDSVKASGHSK